MPPYARPSAPPRPVAEPDVPTVRIDDLARFDNWDKRECAVSNADEWRALATAFVEDHGDVAPIPKHIHQIWIGDREPPCVWLDSWRIDFMNAHGAGWKYTLWDNEAVANMRDEEEMMTGELFDRESMWQCKADLLRLELLYRFGGVYIDADMVSLGKSLEEVRASAEATGFGVSYEADTKDKPYSILGNSIIFASKGHPLLLLLILYIKMIYDHKRPFFGVEWVTGPLAFTKALLFSGMPLTMIPRDYFYAAFQYVPDPSAIDVSHFPNSLGFQFGYTCSGLGDWVRDNNKCRRALDCPYHCKRSDYPLGAIRPFPEEDACVDGDSSSIPKVIHQFCLSEQPPTRWSDSWAVGFCEDNPGWTHKLWDFDKLRELGPFFCAHLYPKQGRPMDAETLRLLALEVLFREGGYYIPLTTIYVPGDGEGESIEDAFPPRALKGLAAAGTIVGSVKDGLSLLKAIRGSYELGRQPKLMRPGTVSCSDVAEMRFPDADAAYLCYASGSRFLGAGEVHFPVSKGIAGSAGCALTFAYDAQVPCYPLELTSLEGAAQAPGSAVLFTDARAAALPRILDAVPGLLYHTAKCEPDWDFLVLSLQWGAGVDDEVISPAECDFLPDGQHCFGIAVNKGRVGHLLDMDGHMLARDVLARRSTGRVLVGTVLFAHDEALSAIYTAMGTVSDAFWRAAGHRVPGWDRDTTEVHGRLLKGLRSGQVAFEISVDEEQRVFYRAFNDDGAMNCEMRIAGAGPAQIRVESARVYYDHEVVFERNGFSLPR